MLIDSCLIIKNEEENIKLLIEQLSEFSHEIHITDTGSSDNTIQILESLQNTYNNLFIHYFEWVMDFSKARNYSLTCYDCKADYQFWCDGDDLLNDKLLESLKEFSQNDSYDADIYYILYKYHPKDNNPHIRTSLLKKSANLEWHDPIHEYIAINSENKLDFTLFDNGSLIIHQRSEENKMSNSSRNLEIFFNMEKTNYKFDDRNRYYYGNELLRAGLIESAITQYHKCIDSDQFSYEKMYVVGRLYDCNDPEFLKYTFKLLEKGYCRRDFFYFLGNTMFNMNHFKLAEVYYKMCLEYPEPQNGFENFAYYVNCYVDSLLQLGLIAYNNKKYKESLDYNNKILEIIPDHEVALRNIDILVNLV